jgi:hypothetical protein
MTVLAFLIPCGILALIVWGIVGFTRGRGADPLTLGTGAAFYARVMTIAGTLVALTGVAVLLKVAFAYLNPAYSYFSYQFAKGVGGPVPVYAGGPSIQTMRSQDLVLAITLLVIGAAVVAGHLFLARLVAGMPGGSPPWITRGTILALTVMTALGGIPSAAIGLYLLLTYFVLGGGPTQQPWGDPIGSAIAFVPAWVYFMSRLVGQLRARPTAAPV